jgi:AraC family transcriptional regulator, positive regulator of tynA and feaB
MDTFISTDEVSESKRLGYWNDVVRLNCPGIEITSLIDAPFFASITTDQAAFIKFTEITTRPSLVTPAKLLADQSGEDYFKVIYQFDGETLICHEDRTIRLGCGDWVFLDSLQPHTLEHTLTHYEHTILILALPKRVFSARLPNPELLTGYTIHGNVGLGRITYDFVQSLRRDIAQIEPEAKLKLAEILVELLATNLRETLCPAIAAARNQAVMLMAAKSFIHRRLGDTTLSVSMIAESLNISKSYLHLLFQGENTTVNRYIWDLRLEKCREDLANPLHRHRKINEIALAYGFSNITHFSRLFKEHYGLSPALSIVHDVKAGFYIILSGNLEVVVFKIMGSNSQQRFYMETYFYGTDSGQHKQPLRQK